MSDKTQTQRIIGNMKRAVTIPFVRQRLDKAILLIDIYGAILEY
jgi:hypothetical protein